MAGWSSLEIPQKIGLSLNLDVNMLENLRDMFDKILYVFLKEVTVGNSIRPVPAMLGDGKCVDLFELFWVVREKGGYDTVSKCVLWGLVAEEIGLGSGVAPSVKLLYFKYLDALDRWLGSIFRDNGKGGGIGVGERLLPVGLDMQCKGQNMINEGHDVFGCEKVGNQVSLQNSHEVKGVTELSSVKNFIVIDDDEDVVILDKSVTKEEVFSRKRKRETLSGMLNWLTEIAKNPSDVVVGKLAEAYKQKMPSTYEDQVVVDQLAMDTIATPCAEIENNQFLNTFDDDEFEKEVRIGPLFQAEIPEWTGMALESDPKWLGTLDWPSPSGEQNLLAERGPIGKGRQDSCECRTPTSIECVRFHIAENKMRLRSELGTVFYTWRFHFMGEEVSLSWTKEEEKKFKAAVRLNPKCFWDQLCRRFRSKSWNSLVSYYYNVFVLRRRAYQNRVTPSSIDSDDDETEFGFLRLNGFGHEAVKVPGFYSIACAHNYQCTDLVRDMLFRNPDSS